MYAVDSPTNPRQQNPSGVPQRSAQPAPAKRPRRTAGSGTPLLLALPALLVLALLLAYPLFRMVWISLHSMTLRDLFSGSDGNFIGLKHYGDILTDSIFWGVTGRTAAFTVGSVFASVVIGLAVALLMRRVARSVRLIMIVAMMFVWAVPQLVQAQIFKWMVDSDFGVINRIISWLPGVNYEGHSWFLSTWEGWTVVTVLVLWAGIPFLAITLSAGLTQVPKELIEAAVMDGATPWQALKNITLPILKPIIVIVSTLSLIWNFGLFTQTYVLRDGKIEPEFQTLATYAYQLGLKQSNYPVGSAVAVVTVLLMMGVMVVYVRQMFKIGEID
jgi:N,N'-diacetylchitobiose transport system permease protein